MPKKRSLDIERQSIEEPTSISSQPVKPPRFNRFNFKEISTTVGLIIVAFLLATIITQYLSVNNPPKTITSQATNSQNNTTITTPKTVSSPNTQKNTPKDPFAPITSDDAQKITQNKFPLAPSKDSFNVRILNGNGINGDGAKLKKELTDKGFKVGSVGNAKLKYDKTMVYFLSGKEVEANLLTENISNHTIEKKEAEAGLISDGYQILIVIGKQ